MRRKVRYEINRFFFKIKNMEQKLKEKLKKIKAVAFDVDGVIFTGRVFMHPKTGEMLKERSHIDGHGLSMLMEFGIKIAFVTSEKTGFAKAVCDKLNSYPPENNNNWSKIDLFLGREGEGKVKIIDHWLKKNKIIWQECAAMGDDIIDIPLLNMAGVSAAPAQAEAVIKKMVDCVTEREGGNGAVRDFCNLLLEAKNN